MLEVLKTVVQAFNYRILYCYPDRWSGVRLAVASVPPDFALLLAGCGLGKGFWMGHLAAMSD